MAIVNISEHDVLAFVASEQIWQEFERACEKFPTWPVDPLHALAVLQEEVGELQKVVLEATYEPGKRGGGERERMRKEAIQCGAMAIRFLMAIDSYEFSPGKQILVGGE